MKPPFIVKLLWASFKLHWLLCLFDLDVLLFRAVRDLDGGARSMKRTCVITMTDDEDLEKRELAIHVEFERRSKLPKPISMWSPFK